MADNKIEVELIAKLDKIEKSLENFKNKTEKGFEDTSKSISFSLENGLGNAVTGLVKQFAPVVATLGLVKAAIDATFQADKINALNRQFEILSDQAGLSADIIRNELVTAAGGLVDGTDIIESANKALVTLGESASAIPETFALARKATALFGGEVTQNFELINQAIATGQTRSLRSIGIIVDQEKAFREYATTLGIATNELSKSGQQQAILNAVLEKGEGAFKNINPNILNTTNSVKALKVSFTDLYESIAVIIEANLGGFFSGVAQSFSRAASDITDRIKSLGGDQESAAAKTRLLNKEFENLTLRVTQFQSRTLFDPNDVRLLNDAQKRLADVRQELSLINETQRKLESVKPRETAVRDAAADQNKIVADARRQKELTDIAAFNVQVAQLTIDGLSEQEIARNTARAKETQENIVFAEQKRLFIEQNNLQGKTLEDEHLAYIQAAEAAHQARVLEIQRQGNVVGLKIAEEFKALQTKAVVGGIQTLTNALLKGENAFEQFGKFILGLIGDFAIKIGSTIIATGIAYASLGDFTGTTPIIYGAALVALGALLKSFAGGGGSPVGGGGGGGTATSDIGGSFGPASTTAQLTAFDAGQVGTVVNVNVAGNVLDRRESGLEIANIIQEHFNTNGSLIAGASV